MAALSDYVALAHPGAAHAWRVRETWALAQEMFGEVPPGTAARTETRIRTLACSWLASWEVANHGHPALAEQRAEWLREDCREHTKEEILAAVQFAVGRLCDLETVDDLVLLATQLEVSDRRYLLLA